MSQSQSSATAETIERVPPGKPAEPIDLGWVKHLMEEEFNARDWREAQELAHSVRYVETAIAQDFQDEFVGAIHIPHASDPYPHLADILPAPVAVTEHAGPRRRIRNR